MKLVVYPPISDHRLAKVREAAAPMTVVQADDEAQAVQEIAEADGMFGYLTKPMLQAAKKLRWVQAPTASMEKFLYPELIESPVQVSNMRAIYVDVITDHVFGFILMFAKNLHIYLRQQLRGEWHTVGRAKGEVPGYGGTGEVTPADRSAITLGDCTLGVVGLGGIGAEIARRGLAFHMTVMGTDPTATEAPEGVTLLRPDKLDDMLGQCDFVVIAAPHTPETFKLFNRERIQKMKPSAYLINVGRGVIVDLADLTAALQAREIAGAGFDVFEEEPLPQGHPLWAMENVLITPHCAALSVRVPERHLEILLDNVRRFANGEPVRNVVDKKRWC